MRVRVGPCPRKGLRRDGICRCFAAVMSFFIHTEADLDHAIARLVDVDPRFGIVLSRAGRPPLRRRPDGFAGLASIVVSQQLSTASAKAIWARLKEAFDPFDHAAVLRARSPQARARRPLRAENSHAQGHRKSHRSRRARSSRAGREAGGRGSCRAHRGSWHRPLDRRHLSSVLPRPCRRLARRRSGVAGGDAAAARARDAPDPERDGTARRIVAAMARCGGLHALVLLPHGQAARRRAD